MANWSRRYSSGHNYRSKRCLLGCSWLETDLKDALKIAVGQIFSMFRMEACADN